MTQQQKQSISDMRYCVNCNAMRPREGWKHIIIKGRQQQLVLRCPVCVARSKQAKSCS